MTIPSFVTASPGATDAGGAWSYTGTAAGAAGRLMMLHVLQAGVAGGAGAITVTSVTNIESINGFDNVFSGGSGYALGGTSGYHYVWMGRSLNTTAPVVTGANSGADDVYVRMYEFQNVATSLAEEEVLDGTPSLGPGFNFTTTSGTTSSVTDGEVTTRGPNRLAINCIACRNDNTIGPFTGMTGGTWAEAVAEYSSATGTDGMLSLQTADMVTTGVINGGSVTMGGATPWDWSAVGFSLRGVGEPHDDDVNRLGMLVGMAQPEPDRRSLYV